MYYSLILLYFLAFYIRYNIRSNQSFVVKIDDFKRLKKKKDHIIGRIKVSLLTYAYQQIYIVVANITY